MNIGEDKLRWTKTTELGNAPLKSSLCAAGFDLQSAYDYVIGINGYICH